MPEPPDPYVSRAGCLRAAEMRSLALRTAVMFVLAPTLSTKGTFVSWLTLEKSFAKS